MISRITKRFDRIIDISLSLKGFDFKSIDLIELSISNEVIKDLISNL